MKKIVLLASLLLTVTSFTQENEAVSEPSVKAPPTKTEEVKIYDVVDEPADYPGGLSAARVFLRNNIKYPQTAIDLGIQGNCYLKFIVSETGTILNIKIDRGVEDCSECDQEAIRLIKSMPKWKPAILNGKPVNSTFILPVQFKLN